MKFSTETSPHIQSKNTVTRVMLQVLIALIPGIIAMSWFLGLGVLIQIVLAVTTAIIAEVIILNLRRRDVVVSLMDLSAVVTAVLLAISLPIMAPWWITVVGTLFAIVIAKHLYGGMGYNPFNPAMAGYVLLLVSFPKQMTAWLTPQEISSYSMTAVDFLRLIFLEQLPQAVDFDGLTMATPLDTIKTQLGLNKTISQIQSGMVFGVFAGKAWEWISLCYLIGGLWLMQRKVIGWQIPFGLLVSLAVFSGLCFLIDSDHYASPVFHLFSGGAMLGAFFIATDPVTAATSAKGRLVYGGMIGILVYIIRVWGGYPDAIAFSVLLANLAVPTIDYYSRPKVFGQSK